MSQGGNKNYITEENFKEWFPKNLLTEEEFNKAKQIKNANECKKYINSVLKEGLKSAAFYYDLYIRE